MKEVKLDDNQIMMLCNFHLKCINIINNNNISQDRLEYHKENFKKFRKLSRGY
jgi:hypothetical protein